MAERDFKIYIVSLSSLSIILVILYFVLFKMCKYRQHGYFVAAALQPLLIAKHHTRTSLRVLPRMLNGDLSTRYFSVANGFMDE